MRYPSSRSGIDGYLFARGAQQGDGGGKAACRGRDGEGQGGAEGDRPVADHLEGAPGAGRQLQKRQGDHHAPDFIGQNRQSHHQQIAHDPLLPKRNSAIFADFCRFLFCFVNVCFSDVNIAILFQSVFAYFD